MPFDVYDSGGSSDKENVLFEQNKLLQEQVLLLKELLQKQNPTKLFEGIEFAVVHIISGGDWNAVYIVQATGNEENLKIIFKDWDLNPERYSFDDLILFSNVMKRWGKHFNPVSPLHFTTWFAWGKLTLKDFSSELLVKDTWGSFYPYYTQFFEFSEEISKTYLVDHDCCRCISDEDEGVITSMSELKLRIESGFYTNLKKTHLIESDSEYEYEEEDEDV